MHILIAPNAFKNSLDAGKAAEAINNGLMQSKLKCTTQLFPVADGGDGTGSLLIEHLKAKRINTIVHDPLMRKIDSSFGMIDQTAIIEMADASGLRLLKPSEYDPLNATTYGTGELILKAIEAKATTIILCIGGSATVDGGVGMLKALGDLSSLNKPKKIVVLCDVENTLLGPEGSAAVFGPQKGASPSQVKQLEERLTRLRDITLKETGKDMAAIKHGGAAGGIAAALNVFLDAQLVNGIDYFLEITQFDKALDKADIVITGEGSLDRQTLRGKGPFGVAKKAKERSIKVIGLAGKISDEEELNIWFDQLICINENNKNPEDALKNTYTNLQNIAKNMLVE
jgi:glycerate 2-kinase